MEKCAHVELTIREVALARFNHRSDMTVRKREDSRLSPRFLAWITRCMMVQFLRQETSEKGHIEGRSDSGENLNSLAMLGNLWKPSNYS